MTWARRFVLALALPCAAASPLRAQETAPPATIVVTELDGIAAEYLTGAIDDADTSNAALVVIVLRTPGGLLDSTRAIVSRMITSRAPVVVFGAPLAIDGKTFSPASGDLGRVLTEAAGRVHAAPIHYPAAV